MIQKKTLPYFRLSDDIWAYSADNNLTDFGCDPNGAFALIVHGWLESNNTEWVSELIDNLLIYRGGCIIFMDYSPHSRTPFTAFDYFGLVPKFGEISRVLLKKLHQMEREGLNPDNWFLFGFSFGAQLVIINFQLN